MAGNNIPQYAFARAGYKDASQRCVKVVERRWKVRLPWIHKKGDEFHSWNMRSWKNQDAVPLWWALRAIL